MQFNINKIRKLFLNFTSSEYAPIYVSSLISLLVTLVTSIVTSWFGSVLIFGQLTALLAISSFINSALGVRTNEATVHFYRLGRIHNKDLSSSYALSNGLIIDILVAALFAVVFVSLSPLMIKVFSLELVHGSAISIFTLYAVLNILSSTPMGAMYAKKSFKSFALVVISSEILFLITLLIYVFKIDEFRLEGLLIIYAVIALIKFTLLIYFSSIIKELPKKIFSDDKEFLYEYMKYALKNFSSTFFKSLNSKIDEIFLVYFAGAESLGVYGLMKKGISPVYFISQPLSASAQAEILDLYQSKPKSIKNRLAQINKSIYTVSVILIPIFIFVSLLYLYFLDVEVDFNVILTSCFIGLSALVINGLWWTRSFTNAVDPIYSLKAAFFLAIFNLIFMPILAYFYAGLGVSLVILIGSLAVSFYFVNLLNQKAV